MKISLLLGLFWCSLSLAAIPKASLILQKTSENAGSGIYQIEQEVQFPNGQDTLVLKETWIIEGENNMRLLVTGAKELKDQVAFTVQINNSRNIDRYFHFRNTEALAQALAQMKLVPSTVLQKKAPRITKDADYHAEPFVRLSRSGGVITYAFGPPSTTENENPGFWVEQDQFVVRKFRLPSGVEVTADRYSSYARGLMFPRTRVVRWGPHQVTIQTISVAAKGREALSQFNQKFANKTDALNNQQAANIVEDFYKRFR